MPVDSGSDTITENQNRENRPGPMGTGSGTSASDTALTVSGCQNVSDKNHATIVQPRKWSAPLLAFGFPTRNGRIDQEERGHGLRRRAGCR